MEEEHKVIENQSPETKRRRKHLLALAASVTACVCGLLAASIFLSPLDPDTKALGSTNSQSLIREKAKGEKLLRDLKQQYARQEKTWAQNHKENTHLIQRLKEELSKKNQNIEEQEEKIKALQELNDEMQNASDNYQFFSSQFAELQKNHKQVKRNNERLTLEQQSTLEQVAELEEAKLALTEQVQAQKQQIEALSLSEEEKQQAWTGLKQEHMHLLTLLQEKESLITQTEKEIEAKDLEMRILNDKANSFKELSDQYIAADQNHQKRIEELEGIVSESTKELESKGQQILTQKQQALKEQETMEQAFLEEKKTLETKKESLIQENALYLSNIELLEHEKQNLINELKQEQKTIKELQELNEKQALDYAFREQKNLAALQESHAKYQREQEMHEDQKSRFNTLLETVKTQKSLLKNIENSRRDIDHELDEMRNAYRQLLSEFASKQSLQSTPSISTSAQALANTQDLLETKKIIHTVAQGETLSQISMLHYGTSGRWEEIYEANRDKIPNQNFVKVGTQLLIP